ncbi:MAG: NAD(P)/FAD-dependent oxidoreductase [Chloroflexi bacterium]|nr:NAD(P)/FAD-dependent oxidoreductase [Chloroflexota bacterium]
MKNANILIVGGGPGGLSTALHLTRLDPRLASQILILEKERYPRPKICAGGLTADAENILQRLGLDVSEIPHVDVKTARFDFAGSGLKIRPRKRCAFRVVRRDEFDAWLADKTRERGVEIREGVTVRTVFPDSDGVSVETDAERFRAQIVVGADGSNGVARRCILPNEPLSTSRTLEVIAPSPNVGDDARFDFLPVPQNIAGYAWDFPTQVKGQPMRCWGIYDCNLLSNFKRPMLKDILANEMAKRGFNLDDCEIQSHPIRWFEPQNTFSAPRVLLVGDAAGVDPLFGEGISVALGYGAVAAREIAESLRRGDFSFRGYKSRLARSGLGQALFARWCIAHLVYSLKWAWFQFLLWRVLQPVVAFAAWVFVLNWSKRIK